MMAEDYDVTVVGAGIVGICCALSLLEKGIAVRLIDRHAPGQGASYGNAGVISPWSCVPQSLPGLWKNIPKWLLDPAGPLAVSPRHLPKMMPWAVKFLRNARPDRVQAVSDAMDALVRPNVDLYRHHLSGTGEEALLRDSWYVHPYRNRSGVNLEGIAWRLRRKRGAPVELVDRNVLREIEPDLSPEFQGAIVVKGQARALSPGRIGEVLARKVQALGGEVLQAGVHRLVPHEGGGWSLTTDLGEILSQTVVIATGAWSARLLEPLGLKVPLEGERGYHLLFKDPGVVLNNSIMDMEGHFVTSSMEMGLRSAGTAEFAGLDAAPNYRRARILAGLTQRLLPALNTSDTEEWMGLRPSLPDSLPCLGEIPGMPGLIAAFGHNHYGLGMAPMTGRVIADIATDTRPNIDLAPYRIDRFGA